MNIVGRFMDILPNLRPRVVYYRDNQTQGKNFFYKESAKKFLELKQSEGYRGFITSWSPNWSRRLYNYLHRKGFRSHKFYTKWYKK